MKSELLMKTLLPVLLITLLPSIGNADIMGVDFSITDGSTFIINNVGPKVLSGGGTDSFNDYSFVFSGLTLDLSIDLPGMATTAGVATTWSFTNIDLAVGEVITGALQTTGFAPASGPTTLSNSILVQISGGDIATSAGGVLNYQFEIQTNLSTAAVPEPSSVAMLCALGLGGVWVRRRRQSAA